MNNSKIVLDDMSLSLDEPVDTTEHFREKESELVRIIEAIERIDKSDEWSTLKSLIFSQTVSSLEKRLRAESESDVIHDSNIYRLQGQLIWARKYADLHRLAESYRTELSNIKKLTQPTER